MAVKKSTFLVSVILIISGCSSNDDPMTDAEKYMADKFSAEWTDVNISQTETKRNGEVTGHREYIGVQVKNSIDINRILEDKNYARKRMESVAQFVLDSVDLGEIPFVPREIEIEYIKEIGFSVFKDQQNQTMVFELASEEKT